MDRKERIDLMLDVRKSVLMIVTAVFDQIDLDLEDYTFTQDNKKLIRAPRARLALKALRTETLDRIASIGAEYEGDSDE